MRDSHKPGQAESVHALIVYCRVQTPVLVQNNFTEHLP